MKPKSAKYRLIWNIGTALMVLQCGVILLRYILQIFGIVSIVPLITTVLSLLLGLGGLLCFVIAIIIDRQQL
ncbi:MAG: hypothetical protein F6J87_00950 [Spirulina sp. SIO3F2]|nr:hypothetical protein [Spirulina sp. SIO3F2]